VRGDIEAFTDFREGYLGAPEYRVLAEAIMKPTTTRDTARSRLVSRLEALVDPRGRVLKISAKVIPMAIAPLET
jgi:hypothetical protein